MSYVPVQCLACQRLLRRKDEAETAPGDALDATRCTAYPEGIPVEIALEGFDHRRPFGGEKEGRLFLQRADEEGLEAFQDWLSVYAGVDSGERKE
jgi:hypothetical protein